MIYLSYKDLGVPAHFDPGAIEDVRRIDYQNIATTARQLAIQAEIQPTDKNRPSTGLLLVDCQNTFCTPGFSLFVAGRSGRGAVDDSIRICEFIYRNLTNIDEIIVSMDTHKAYQVFHSPFFVNGQGKHPDPYTEISVEDIQSGRWKVNPLLVDSAATNHKDNLEQYVLHYCRTLEETGKYRLMIWPFHAMLGGVGHALVASIEEAVFYHTIARQHQAKFLVKGDNPLTENYSVLGPEVQTDEQGNRIAYENEKLVELLLSYDRVLIAGQAKSHCVAWTVQDLLAEIRKRDERLAQKIYLLEDCTSPVVVPGGQDFTERADETFEKFKAAGMHLVKSTDPMSSWPGMPPGE